MWCVAELNAEYIAKMEDVLALYERPYSPHEPVVCLDEKTGVAARGGPAAPPRPPRASRKARQRVPSVWDGQRFRHCRAESGTALHVCLAGSLRPTVCADGAARRHRLSTRPGDSLGDGQSQYPLREVADRHVRPARGPPDLATPARALHSQARELAEPSRTRAQSRQSRLLRGAPHRHARAVGRRNARLVATRRLRARTRIQWRFTRKDARRKFGYKTKLSTRSQT